MQNDVVLGNWNMTMEFSDRPKDIWLEFDEKVDVLASLRALNDAWCRCDVHPEQWKWVLLGAHSALQGALTCTLMGSDRTGCLTNTSFKEMHVWFEASRTNPKLPKPKEFLADLLTLFSRSRKAVWMSNFGGSPLCVTREAAADVRDLHKRFRNQFTHFLPIHWSIEVAGLPRIIGTAIGFAETLMLQHPACTIALDQAQDGEFVELFTDIKAQLAQIGAKMLADDA